MARRAERVRASHIEEERVLPVGELGDRRSLRRIERSETERSIGIGSALEVVAPAGHGHHVEVIVDTSRVMRPHDRTGRSRPQEQEL